MRQGSPRKPIRLVNRTTFKYILKASHKSKQLKVDRGITSVQSEGLCELTNHLLHVGTRKYVIL